MASPQKKVDMEREASWEAEREELRKELRHARRDVAELEKANADLARKLDESDKRHDSTTVRLGKENLYMQTNFRQK